MSKVKMTYLVDLNEIPPDDFAKIRDPRGLLNYAWEKSGKFYTSAYSRNQAILQSLIGVGEEMADELELRKDAFKAEAIRLAREIGRCRHGVVKETDRTIMIPAVSKEPQKVQLGLYPAREQTD